MSETHKIKQGINDPVAPLILGNNPSNLDRINSELITHLGEKNTNHEAGFYTALDYDLIGDKLVCLQTGERLEEVLVNGYNTTLRVNAYEDTYAVQRERQRLYDAVALKSWLQAGGHGTLYQSSLVPPKTELAEDEAKALNFNQQTMRSVSAAYTASGGRIHAEYFSLVDHDLAMQQVIVSVCGSASEVSLTTLDEVSRFYQLDYMPDPVGVIRGLVGQRDERSIDPAKAQLAVTVYHRFLKSIELSVKSSSTTAALASLAMGEPLMTNKEVGQRYDMSDARYDIDQLINVILPALVYLNTDSYSAAGLDTSSPAAARSSSNKVFGSQCPTDYGPSNQPLEDSGVFGRSYSSLFMNDSANRRQKARELEAAQVGFGRCQVHPKDKPTKLYGCGVFCQDCNKKWCEAYKKGRTLSVTDLVRLRAKERKASLWGRSLSAPVARS